MPYTISSPLLVLLLSPPVTFFPCLTVSLFPHSYGIALLTIFKREIKADQFKSGEHFWAHVSNTCHSENFDFEQLHIEAFEKNKKFLFRIMARTSKVTTTDSSPSSELPYDMLSLLCTTTPSFTYISCVYSIH